MCGIIGHISSNPIHDTGWISNGLSIISHRGPDDLNIITNSSQNCVLGHSRLSIIDLSSNGSQPMTCSQTGVYLVFNGEIYNYKEIKHELNSKGVEFNSSSDTEVVLKSYIQWGTDCFSKLTGMFALAIYDEKNKKAIIARDRAGEKPLYYFKNNESLYFCSELKGLLENPNLPRNLSHSSFDSYLYHGYVQRDKCILDGYNKLKSGHFIEWPLNENLKETCYWSIENSKFDHDDYDQSDNDLFIKFDELLGNSISRQLRSDVPVGVLLSGGIDSTLVTSYASKYKENIDTYTVSFPQCRSLDESSYAQNVSKLYKTNHHVLEANPDCVDLLPKLAQQFDEPLVDSSMIPTFIVCQMVSRHCKVVLGGDGGDEVFGGYPHYSRLLKVRNYLKQFPSFSKEIISYFSDNYLPHGFKGKNYLSIIKHFNKTDIIPQPAIHFDLNTRQKILSPFSYKPKDMYNYNINNDNFENNLMKTDFCNYLSEDILVKIDRCSMLNSIEMRAPLLDHNIIEFAFNYINHNQKFTVNQKKKFLKKFCRKIFPCNYDFKRKQGFELPITKWLKKGKFRDFFMEILLDKSCIFDESLVINLFKMHNLGFSNSERLFSLLFFELWRKKYNIYL